MTSSRRTKLDFSAVAYAVLKDERKGVALGEERKFLDVEWTDGQWKLRLWDHDASKYITTTCRIAELEELHMTTKKTKGLRSTFRALYENHDQLIEWVILVITSNVDEWQPSEESAIESPTEAPTSEISEIIALKVQELQAAPNKIEIIQKYLDHVIVGEQSNKMAIFILLLSAKFSEARLKQMILLKGDPGGGKSTLMRELTAFYRIKDVGRFSAHALDYADLSECDILVLKELGQMDMEKQGVSTLKFLSADDQGYKVEITSRDEATGRFTTTTYEIPPITVLSSTTRLDLDPQFQRRAWLFPIDDSKNQTERVTKYKADFERQTAEKALGIRRYTQRELSSIVLKEFVAGLEPRKIIIPFPETLSRVLGYKKLRIRGDVDKLYAFIKFYALINPTRLIEYPPANVYFVPPEIAIEALRIIAKPMAGMILELDERTLKVFEELPGLELTNTLDVITKADRNTIARNISCSERYVRVLLNSLATSGYFSKETKGRMVQHTLIYSLSEIQQKMTEDLEILNLSTELITEMQKEAQTWLKFHLENKSLREGQKNWDLMLSRFSGEPNDNIKAMLETPAEIEKTEKKIPSHSKMSSGSELSPKPGLKAQRTLNERKVEKSPEVIIPIEKKEPNFEPGTYQCPLCTREMRFTKADLPKHLSEVHLLQGEEITRTMFQLKAEA